MRGLRLTARGRAVCDYAACLYLLFALLALGAVLS